MTNPLDGVPPAVPHFPPPRNSPAAGEDAGPYRTSPANVPPPARPRGKTIGRRPELPFSNPPRADVELRREIALADFDDPRVRSRRENRYGGGGLFGRQPLMTAVRLVVLAAIALRFVLVFLRLRGMH